MKRIKKIHQKGQGNNFTDYPIGVDSIYVDMLSNLDLEEELKIGNNHSVTIQDIYTEVNEQSVFDHTEIKQYYYDLPLDNNNKQILYYVETIIDSTGNLISSKLYQGNKVTELHQKDIKITQDQNLTTIGQTVEEASV